MKTKIGLLISSILIVILAISSLWLYTETNTLQKQVSILQTEKDNLQIQINNLQNQIDLLNATYQNYMETHSYSNSEYNTLQTEISNLTVQLSDLQNQMDLLNATYQNYMETHSYSNSEYNTLQTEISNFQEQIDWLLNELGEANFFFYYVKQPEQKFGVYNLRDELNSLEWGQPYQRDIFDCSEMSANLEWYLENRGWHTFIVVGDTPFDSGRHAWLIVETSVGHYMPVESVTIEVVWWEDPYYDNYWNYDNMFETIQEAVDYNESGFDWWKSAGLGSKILIG